ncbi:fatty acid desaturase [Mesorhizobium sp.]|uniref:fatty acid desaturase n=1 Tax=Mesorhizobium sp. TaxID=1871066 RepID=UPI00257B8B68|nr:fatty acid desaturase [Mesorhizobium sp.]
MSIAEKRDYSILGPEKEKAVTQGLISAVWYQSPVPRNRMKELTKRRNLPAFRDTVLWIALLGASGYVAWLSWGTWWSILTFAVYGTLYAVPAGSKWHEFGHGTPFRTPWLNEIMAQFCAFLSLSPASTYRWTHVRHHTDTIIVGSDPEIVAPRPPHWGRLLTRYLHPTATVRELFSYASGRMSKELKALIPASEQKKLFWEARSIIAIYSCLVALSFYWGTIAPLMFIGLPAFYGVWLNYPLGWTQHLGLYEDTLDHRLCTRTFKTNAIIRFLYTNMNYHVEHHMFPMIPYYNLPALHEEIKEDCPDPAPSFRAAVRETIDALRKQRHDPNYIVPRIRSFAERVGRATMIDSMGLKQQVDGSRPTIEMRMRKTSSEQ